MQCDVNNMKPMCSQAVIGLKTEFECKLIQDRCIGLKGKAIKSICNDGSYGKAERQSFAGGSSSIQGGGNGSPDNSASTFTVTSVLSTLLASVLFAFVFVL